MQLPRVIIAAVFFIIGAVIAVPALMRTTSSSQASGTPSHTMTPSGSTSSASPRPGTKVTLRTTAKGSVTPTQKPAHKVTVTPTSTTTVVPPAVPLTATISAVRCPSRTVVVTTRNLGTQTQDYKIDQPGSSTLYDRIDPRGTRVNKLTLTEGTATDITVTWSGHTVKAATRTAHCVLKTTPPPTKLPHTGIDQAGLYAKIATGVAAMITGVIVFWYGGIWPRRRDAMLSSSRTTPDDVLIDGPK